MHIVSSAINIVRILDIDFLFTIMHFDLPTGVDAYFQFCFLCFDFHLLFRDSIGFFTQIFIITRLAVPWLELYAFCYLRLWLALIFEGFSPLIFFSTSFSFLFLYSHCFFYNYLKLSICLFIYNVFYVSFYVLFNIS